MTQADVHSVAVIADRATLIGTQCGRVHARQLPRQQRQQQVAARKPELPAPRMRKRTVACLLCRMQARQQRALTLRIANRDNILKQYLNRGDHALRLTGKVLPRTIARSSTGSLHLRLCMLIAAVTWLAPCAQADNPPPPAANSASRLELGIGIAGAHFADYPGAARYWNFLLPIPFITLHTPRLDADREGITGKLLHAEHWAVDVDFSASVPVNSSRDAPRSGMPNLGWIGEAGPVLKYRTMLATDSGLKLEVGLPLRAAVSTDGWKLHHRGWVVEPWVELSREWRTGERDFHADVTLSALYANSDYFNYLYGVAPQYATLTRPAYFAGSGRGGYRVSLGFGWRQGDMVYGAFYRYINLGGASFNASPLVEQRHQNAFGFMVAWVFRTIDY